MLQRYKKYYTCAKKILLFLYIATPFLCCGKRDSLAQFICLYRSKPLGRDKSPPSESVKKPCLLIKNKKESTFRTPFCFWRRERDSNPRNLSVQRFSRPPQSTTLPSLLRNRLQKYCFFLNCANFYALFLRISIFYSNFAPKIVQKCCYKYLNPRYTA